MTRQCGKLPCYPLKAQGPASLSSPTTCAAGNKGANLGEAVSPAVAEQPAHQQDGGTNARQNRARSGRPASITISRTASPVISPPTFQVVLAQETTRTAGQAQGSMHARQAGARRQRSPSVATPTVLTDRPNGAYRPS